MTLRLTLHQENASTELAVAITGSRGAVNRRELMNQD